MWTCRAMWTCCAMWTCRAVRTRQQPPPWLAAFVAFALALAALPVTAAPVDVFAAASLRPVLQPLAAIWGRAHPEAPLRLTYGASGALAVQMANGAPAAVFLAAHAGAIDGLRASGVISPLPGGVFAYNTLVLVGREAAGVRSMADLPRLKRIALGTPSQVPAGEYALAALRAAGVLDKVQSALVYAKDVRACLLYAERGEVEGAFVYATDALAAPSLPVRFAVPQALYPRVTYAYGVARAAADRPEVRAFAVFLASPAARAELARQGFLTD